MLHSSILILVSQETWFYCLLSQTCAQFVLVVIVLSLQLTNVMPTSQCFLERSTRLSGSSETILPSPRNVSSRRTLLSLFVSINFCSVSRPPFVKIHDRFQVSESALNCVQPSARPLLE